MITVLKYYGITMVFVLVERVDVYIFPDWICIVNVNKALKGILIIYWLIY